MSHNELHCRTSFPFCLELLLLPLFFQLDISFCHLLVSVVTKSSILTQPENSAGAADRQISMIIVITNDKGCSQSFLLNPE